MNISLQELNRRFAGFWHVGRGPFVVVCEADRRVSFCETREQGNEIFAWGCAGRKCEGQKQHLAFKLEDVAPAQPARVSKWFRDMVASDD